MSKTASNEKSVWGIPLHEIGEAIRTGGISLLLKPEAPDREKVDHEIQSISGLSADALGQVALEEVALGETAQRYSRESSHHLIRATAFANLAILKHLASPNGGPEPRP